MLTCEITKMFHLTSKIAVRKTLKALPSFEGCYLIQPARCMVGESCFACDVTRQGALKKYAELKL